MMMMMMIIILYHNEIIPPAAGVVRWIGWIAGNVSGRSVWRHILTVSVSGIDLCMT